MANKRPQQQHVNRKTVSRREQEQKLRQRVIIGTAAVLGLVVLLLGWGLYDQYVLQPKRPVATVYGKVIPVSEYQKRYKYRYWDYTNYLSQLQSQKQQFDATDEQQAIFVQYMDQQISQLQSEIRNLPLSVMDEMVDEKLYAREAEARGITVSSEEIELSMEEQFGYQRNPPTPEPTSVVDASDTITDTPAPTPTLMSYEEYEEQSERWLQAVDTATGLQKEDFRKIVEATLIRQKVEQAIKDQVPTATEQVKARHILVETLDEAQAVLAKLDEGQDFAELAAEYSIDTSNNEQGGDLGWFGRDRMVPEFEQPVFALPVGEVSAPIETDYGYHIVIVDDHQASREMDADALASAQQQAVDEWLTAQRDSEGIVKSWDSTMMPEIK